MEQDREERVRQRAQEIYEARVERGLDGDAVGDWLQAEAEIAADENRARD